MEELIEQQLKALINPYNDRSANKSLTVDYVKSQKAKCIALLTDRMQYMNQSSADYKEYDFLARSLLNGWLVSDINSLKTLYQTVQKLPEADGKRRRGEALLDQYKFVKADTLTKRAALHQLSLNTLFSVNTTVSRTYLSNFGKRTVFPLSSRTTWISRSSASRKSLKTASYSIRFLLPRRTRSCTKGW